MRQLSRYDKKGISNINGKLNYYLDVIFTSIQSMQVNNHEERCYRINYFLDDHNSKDADQNKTFKLIPNSAL